MLEQIHKDLMYLAGKLLHRGAQTKAEREAASFIRDRLGEYAFDVDTTDFHTLDNYNYLFGCYFAEFIMVAFIAFFWPFVALLYGIGVFVCFMAEFFGHPVFSRIMPQFESQNVVARYLADTPKRILVVCAHYDSGCANPLSHPVMLPWLRSGLRVMVASMVMIIVTCALDVLGLFQGATYAFTEPMRWSLVCVLMSGSFFLFYASSRGEDIRGANGNASGVTALLRLAERLKVSPIENADIYLVATGSHESWMNGMRHLLDTEKFDKETTRFINLECVGAGELHFLEKEGMLHVMAVEKTLRETATHTGESFGITPARLHSLPTEAHLLHARGYKAVTIMGLDEKGFPPHWNWFSDRVTEVEESTIAHAADYAEALLRALAQP